VDFEVDKAIAGQAVLRAFRFFPDDYHAINASYLLAIWGMGNWQSRRLSSDGIVSTHLQNVKQNKKKTKITSPNVTKKH
jgi:hypothetical protein